MSVFRGVVGDRRRQQLLGSRTRRELVALDAAQCRLTGLGLDDAESPVAQTELNPVGYFAATASAAAASQLTGLVQI